MQLSLVIKYRTLEDAVSGSNPKNGEISLRIRRHIADVDDKTLLAAMDVLADACQVFRDAGKPTAHLSC